MSPSTAPVTANAGGRRLSVGGASFGRADVIGSSQEAAMITAVASAKHAPSRRGARARGSMASRRAMRHTGEGNQAICRHVVLLKPFDVHTHVCEARAV